MNVVIKKMRDFLVKRYILFTPLLFFMSFPSFDVPVFAFFPVFAWFCLVPLLLFIRERPLKQVYILSFLAFLLSNFLAFGWMRQFGKGAPGGEYIVLAFLMPSLSILFATRIFLAEYLSRRNERLRLLIFPAVWLLFDLIQSIGYLSFPWTFFGYTQYPVLPLLQLASVAGVHGISFLVLLSNSALALILRDRPYSSVHECLLRNRLRFTVFILIILIFAIGSIRLFHKEIPAEKTLRITMIQSCISPWDNWDVKKMSNLAELKRLSDTYLKSDTEFLIWSESATLEPISFRRKYGSGSMFDMVLYDYIRSKGVPLFTGEIGVIQGRRGQLLPQNNAILISADTSAVKSYSKIHLAPFGEWFPYDKILPWVSDIALSMGASVFVPGKTPVIFEIKGIRFGPLICYEGMFFRLNREYANLGADFFLNISNDGWSSSYGGHMQHFAAAPFRAVENGIPFVRAGNTGYTAIVDPYGRVISSIPILNKGGLSADIKMGARIVTFYSKFGDILLYLCLAIILLPVVILMIKQEYEKRRNT